MTNDRLHPQNVFENSNEDDGPSLHWCKDRSLTIMSQEELAKGKRRKLWTKLEINGLVRNLSPVLWQMDHLHVLYLNDNNIQRLPPDIGKLVNLRYLDLSNNKLRILPAEIGSLINLKALLLNDNNLRTLPFELGKLFKLQKLGLNGNSLGNDILQLYNQEPKGTQNLLSYLLDILTIQNPAPRPSPRPWIQVDQPVDRTKPSCMFTVMCYNVLCDKYANRNLYGYCPSWALKWEYRRSAILDELKSNSADVIALQEIEADQYHNHLLKDLGHEGYEGVFSPKSRYKTMSSEEKKYVDGCAIFYKTSKFSLISEHLIEFNALAMANAHGSDVMLNRVMTKDNIALAALLQIKEEVFESINLNEGSENSPGGAMNTISMAKFGANGSSSTTSTTFSATPQARGSKTIPLHQQQILVCTAHIHWDPQNCDVKMIQAIMLTHEIQAIANQAAKDLLAANNVSVDAVVRMYNLHPQQQQQQRKSYQQQGTNSFLDDSISGPAGVEGTGGDDSVMDQLGAHLIPLILCGDFNSLPDSGVFEFLTRGSISADHKDFKKLAYKDCLRRICNSKSSAMANSPHSQLNQSHQYSKQHSILDTANESTVDEQLEFDEAGTGNGIQQRRAPKNGAGLLQTAAPNNEHNTYTHPFKLATAYKDRKTMPCTNYVFHFRGIIDYIFYSSRLMSVLGVSGFDKSWLEENNIPGLPHPYFPSDHFPLYVELEILPTPRGLGNYGWQNNYYNNNHCC